MKKWMMMAAVLLVVMAGCSEKNTLLAKAHIVERKALANGRLRVNYIFTLDNHTTIKDSADVDRERVVPHDSVTVRFSPKDPSQNSLQLP
ncbi:hypothetical protein SAMN05421788_111114 [Filimonas lacunae]|uniref:Uncharacterized protein n=1 Tax=Filimonas lacunae TaxID=477680 RepID=A0A173MAX6_9BACT|nr:hypothetical protein [Filimonas lacunae]BAV04686.1 hypothetical protein FLA_0680 [Filimonas lacunae]SIT32383.1 hypothetical protein SAMN05421788_111114 [Filimonas lacunae]